jgi:hypothetical protein
LVGCFTWSCLGMLEGNWDRWEHFGSKLMIPT